MEKTWIETEFMREVRTEKGRAARRGGGAVSLTRLDGNGTGTESRVSGPPRDLHKMVANRTLLFCANVRFALK